MSVATETQVPADAGDATQTSSASGQTRSSNLPSVEALAKFFPQLEIIECLGRGGMGVVYKARQPRLNRLVALKLLAPEKGSDPQFAERFEGEAKALAQLNHPDIVTVYDFGETNGLFYLLMEFVDGVNLRQLMRSQKITPEQALAIVPRICEALQYAHDRGIVHRDIKPENILLDRQGQLKIADFGIAKIMGVDLPALAGAAARQIVGTPNYMAPEQVAQPRTVDHRADIYSLGVVFYELLTGELPRGNFPPPSRKVQIDVRLDEIVLRALEREPERRYQQASQVKSDVETITGVASDKPDRSPAEGGSLGGLRPEVKAAQGHLKLASMLLLVLGILTYSDEVINIIIVNALPLETARTVGKWFFGLDNFLSPPFLFRVIQFLQLDGLRSLLGPLALVSAWQLRKAKGFHLANLTILLSFFQFSLWLFTFPLGLSALVLIWRKRVQDAFAAKEKMSSNQPFLIDEQKDSYSLSLASAVMVLLTFLSLPAFSVGSFDFGLRLGLANLVLSGMRQLPHLSQGAGIVFGIMALLKMLRAGSPARGLEWALFGTLFPCLVWIMSVSTKAMEMQSPFDPRALDPGMEQYGRNALMALAAPMLIAGLAGLGKAIWLRRGSANAIRRLLNASLGIAGLGVVGYLGVMSYTHTLYYFYQELWLPYVIKFLETALVLGLAGWLANRKIDTAKTNTIRTVLKLARLAFLSISLIIAIEVGFYLAVGWQSNRLLFFGRFDEKYQFLTQHFHITPPAESQPKALVARLATRSIELETVSEPADREVTCWYPDGTIRCRQTVMPSGSSAIRTGIRELLFCVAGNGSATNLDRLHWECFAAVQRVEQACFGYELLWKTKMPDVKGIEIKVPAAASSARLRLGIPNGPWEDTDAVWPWRGDQQAPRKKSISYDGEDWEFGFAGVSDTVNRPNSPPGLEVTYIAPVKRDTEAQLVAVDLEGKRHEPQSVFGQSGIPWFGNKIGQSVINLAFFPDMNLKQLKELRFQVRHYGWVEFDNVSLQPGQHTQVKVKNATISPSPEK